MRKILAVVLMILTAFTAAAGESAAGGEDVSLHMPYGDEYTKVPIGVIAYRNNAFRQNAACGTIPEGVSRMLIRWERWFPLVSTEYECGGFEWNGQPLIIKWAKQVREKTVFGEDFEDHTAMKEVIAANTVGVIRFLDLETGEDTRKPLDKEIFMNGGMALHPSGMPYLSASQGWRQGKNGVSGLQQYNMYDLSEYPVISSLNEDVVIEPGEEELILSAPLIDRKTGRIITAGSNGYLYNIKLNSRFDYEEGLMEVAPEVTAATPAGGTEISPGEGFAAPLSVLGRFIYCADTSGILRCVDSGSMKTIWEKDMEDTVFGAMPLEIRKNRIVLYAANTVTDRDDWGDAAVVCLDAITGDEIWRLAFPMERGYRHLPVWSSGFLASPLVGQEGLDGMLYATVTGLEDKAWDSLGLSGQPESALIAIDKETGGIQWMFPMQSPCFSSPVAVYDDTGAGRIIQCNSGGVVRMLDGLTGDVIREIQLEGAIEASPAVYGDMMVITATDGGFDYIYGILLAEEETDVPYVYEPFAPFGKGI